MNLDEFSGVIMEWDLWRPEYEKIVDKLGIDVQMDEEARDILAKRVARPNLGGLRDLIEEEECIVFGAGPSLDEDLEKLSEKNRLNDCVLITADGATEAVINRVVPDVIVTDLDGSLDPQLRGWREGAWVVVHGHGDNIEGIEEIVPKIEERIVGTTQVKPTDSLHNFGGFTDGDRAAFMAHELGGSKIYLAGMDLGNRIGKYSGGTDESQKLIKLEICKDLLSWLAGDLRANLVNITSSGENIPNVPSEDLSSISAS